MLEDIRIQDKNATEVLIEKLEKPLEKQFNCINLYLLTFALLWIRM